MDIQDKQDKEEGVSFPEASCKSCYQNGHVLVVGWKSFLRTSL